MTQPSDETTLQMLLSGQGGVSPSGSTPGVPGPPGQTGKSGPPGPDAEQAEDGVQIPGQQGHPGPAGQVGQPGWDGDEGQEGLTITGPPGPPGQQGFQGQPGLDGEDGQDGAPLNLGAGLPGATSSASIAAPTAPNSTSAFTMQGLAGSITPRKSGNILVSIAGTVTAANATTVDNGIILQGSYGTGAAPASNDPLTGTQAGAVQEFTWPVSPTAVGDVNYGFNVIFLIVAQLGTTLWLDLAAKAVTTVSDAPLANVVITAIEI